MNPMPIYLRQERHWIPQKYKEEVNKTGYEIKAYKGGDESINAIHLKNGARRAGNVLRNRFGDFQCKGICL